MNKKLAPSRRKIIMAAPLDIIQASRKMKAFRFKAGRATSRQISPPHPLDTLDTEESFSDSETESFLDSSYNESISSVTTDESWCASSTSPSTTSYSWSPKNLRLVSLVPVVLTSCIATYSPKSLPNTPVSSSKLTQLLKDSQSTLLCESEKPQESTFSYTFPKTSKLSAWQAFLAFFINYSMRSAFQKDSGESFPEAAPKACSQTEDQDMEDHIGEELETFGGSAGEPCEVVFYRSKARNREHRVNSEFLKRYAMDCNARINGVLPINPDDLTTLLCRPSIRTFDEKHGLNRLSEISRDKLWNSVILPPRKDPCPRNVIDSDTYVFSPEETRRASIVSKYSTKLPWATHQSSMKPAGRFRTSACLKSNASPTLGHSTPQYTVKGWQNERWTPVLALG